MELHSGSNELLDKPIEKNSPGWIKLNNKFVKKYAPSVNLLIRM